MMLLTWMSLMTAFACMYHGFNSKTELLSGFYLTISTRFILNSFFFFFTPGQVTCTNGKVAWQLAVRAVYNLVSLYLVCITISVIDDTTWFLITLTTAFHSALKSSLVLEIFPPWYKLLIKSIFIFRLWLSENCYLGQLFWGNFDLHVFAPIGLNIYIYIYKKWWQWFTDWLILKIPWRTDCKT